jgi:hypothetical protein
MNSVLHIIPSVVRLCNYDGTYKDIMGRAQLFESSGIDYKQAFVSRDDPSELDASLSEFSPTHVFVEYTYYRNILNSLRKHFPDAIIAARAHNIEALQHFENHGLFPMQGTAWLLYGMMRLFLSDATYRRKADVIYPISEWEGRVYWRWLRGKSVVKWLPYFAPDFAVSRRRGALNKRNIIVCIPGTADYPRNRDTVARFLDFAHIARQISLDYRFIITGDLAGCGISIPQYVETPGMVDEVADLLAEARAVAVLSPRGYGFKTTIADALANGCYALVHPQQFDRGPAVLRNGCVQVGKMTHAVVQQALEHISKPYSHSSANAHLRERATEILRKDFFD